MQCNIYYLILEFLTKCHTFIIDGGSYLLKVIDLRLIARLYDTVVHQVENRM